MWAVQWQPTRLHATLPTAAHCSPSHTAAVTDAITEIQNANPTSSAFAYAQV